MIEINSEYFKYEFKVFSLEVAIRSYNKRWNESGSFYIFSDINGNSILTIEMSLSFFFYINLFDRLSFYVFNFNKNNRFKQDILNGYVVFEENLKYRKEILPCVYIEYYGV